MAEKVNVISSNLLVYGTAHCVVDAVCAGILFSILREQSLSVAVLSYLFVVYNLLAFGLQILVGLIIDTLKAPRLSALLGIILTGISAVIYSFLPVAGVVLAGVGNAFFHIGGGIICLNLTPRKATAPGIFVAPGALGLMAGTLLGKGGYFTAFPFLLIMASLAVIIFLIPKPEMYRRQSATLESREFKFEYVLYLVLFVVAVRSLVGWAVVFPWKADVFLLVVLVLSVAIGKGLGGFIADRYGWTPVATGSLAMSIPLLVLGVNIPVLGMLGMLLFNVTMPITLTMVSNMLPGRPGTAFGLTCLALILGALPVFSEINTRLSNQLLISGVVIIAAIALYFGLRLYHRIQEENQGKSGYSAGPNREIKQQESE